MCFSYKGGMHRCTRIEVIKRRAGLTDKWLEAISNVMLFKTVTPLRNYRIKF